MPVKQREKVWYVMARWKGICQIRQAVSEDKKIADAQMRSLEMLRDTGHYELLRAIQDGRVDLRLAHNAVAQYLKRPADKRGALALTIETLSPGAQQTLGSLTDEWLAWLARPSTVATRTKRGYSKNTQLRYKEAWSSIFSHLPGGRNAAPNALTKAAWDVFVDARISAGTSGATINRHAIAVSGFYRWLGIEHPEINAQRPVMAKREEADPLQADAHCEPEQLSLIAAASPPGWADLWYLLAGTGLRVGELQHVQVRDVDLAKCLVSVVSRPEYRLKTPKSARQVPLSPDVAERLKARMQGKARTDYVLAEEERDYGRASYQWERSCLDAGVLDEDAQAKGIKRHGLSLHSLRHAYGVACVRAGLHLVRVRDLLGHTTLTTTQRYARFAANAQEQAEQAAAVAQALAPKVSDTPVTQTPPARPRPRRARRPKLQDAATT